MANARNKTVDKTFLSIDQAEERGFIHRDYIAHCLRWSHVVKYVGSNIRKGIKILDVGCGREMPLPKTLYSSRLIPELYVGIDVGPINMPDMFHTGKFPIKLVRNADFADPNQVNISTKFDVITCFEVAEHVEPEHTVRMLARIREALSDNGRAFVSTPCYDPAVGAAANHVNEMTYSAFGAMLERVGFNIERVYGTFASMRDYVDALTPVQKEMFDKLRDYYDVNYLATIFAPLFPHKSRNALWVLSKHGVVRRFPELQHVPKPWSSSELRQDELLTTPCPWATTDQLAYTVTDEGAQFHDRKDVEVADIQVEDPQEAE